MHTPFNHLHSTCVQFQFSTCKSWFNVLQSFKIDLINKIWLIKGYKKVSLFMYTVLHIFAQMLTWARNQSNHQKFDPSLLPKKRWLIFMEMKKENWKKNPKLPIKKKTANSQYFSPKLVLGWVGLIDAKGIDVAQPIWSSGCLT